MALPRTLLGLLLAACAALLVATPAHALDARGLGAKLSRESGRLGPRAGAYVVDLESGRTLFSSGADKRLVPASNEKLFTTAATLLTFGGDTRRETQVIAVPVDPDEPDEVATVKELYLVGAGDPSFGTRDLSRLASQLRRAGVKRVRGGVTGDGSLFDARRGSVDSGFRPDFDLAGQLGGLVVSHGATDRVGPGHLAATKLQSILARRGVRFGRSARTGRAPVSALDVLATDRSPTIGRLIRDTNRASDNFYAEMLMKLVGSESADGAPATTSIGAAAVSRRMVELGLRPRIADGSGLSRRNKTTGRQVVTLLKAMREGDEATAWLGSLPVAGRNGTLRHRMRGTSAQDRCRGKTGTLRGVSALSGYCTTSSGRVVAFSFIENGVGGGAKSVEDRMVAAVARYAP